MLVRLVAVGMARLTEDVLKSQCNALVIALVVTSQWIVVL